MKTILNLLVLYTLLVVTITSSQPVHASANRIEFTVIETCNDDLTLAKVMIAGPNFHAFDLSQTCYENGSIPQATGTAYLSGGAMHLVDGHWAMNGVSRIETEEGGVWEGRWTFTAGVFEYVAHGKGMYSGQQYFSISNQNGDAKGFILIP